MCGERGGGGHGAETGAVWPNHFLPPAAKTKRVHGGQQLLPPIVGASFLFQFSSEN